MSKTRTPVRCVSKVLKAFFTEMEHCGIPAKVYSLRPRESHNWRNGRHCPKILSVEEMAERVGYEIVLRKKET